MFTFDADELEGIAPHSVQEQYLAKFNFQLPPVPEGYAHVPENPQAPPQPQTTDFVNAADAGKVNFLQARRGGKKRATLVQGSGASVPSAKAGPSTNGITSSLPPAAPASRRVSLVHIPDSHPSPKEAFPPSSSRVNNSFPSPSEQPFDVPDWSRHDQDVDMDVPIDALDTSSPAGKGKRKATTDLAGDDTKPAKARTLGGDRNHTIPAAVKEIVGWSSGSGGGGGAWHETKLLLPVPPLLNYLSSEVEASEDVFEARNNEEDGMLSSFTL